MRKKLLTILSRYLYPVDGGRKESLNHYLKELHDNYSYEIHVLCFLESGQNVEEKDIPSYIETVTILKDVSAVEIVKNIVVRSMMKKWPLQCSIYYSEENFKKIRSYVRDWKPDVIFTEMIRTSTYYSAFTDSNARTIANLDDMLSKRYMRQMNSGSSMTSFAGAYSGKMPNCLSGILNKKIFRNLILNIEAGHCAIWEKKIYEIYDFTLMTSDIETKELNQLQHGNKAYTLSVGIDYDYYSDGDNAVGDREGLSYVGNFSVASNADTLEMIINEILPYVHQQCRFYVIGKCPAEILERYKNNSRVVFCGRVDDLRTYVKRTRIFLAPIAYGTGIKTKIIEAMAMGMPVITNSVGSEGINAENMKEMVVCDDMKQIAKYVDLLYLNKDEADRIGRNAAAFAKKNFDWKKVLKVFQDMKL